MILGVQLYTAIFLQAEDKEVLMLKRAEWKKFAPNEYTGIGGKVNPEELKNIELAMFRELEEETTIKRTDVKNLTFKGRLLVTNRPDGDHLLYYYLGQVNKNNTKLDCNEGTLEWFSIAEANKLPIIQTTKTCFKFIFEPKEFSGVFDHLTSKFSYIP